MTDPQASHDALSLRLKPIISYPREAQIGQRYVMTIDVQLAIPDLPWQYAEEEYPITFLLNSYPYFKAQPLSSKNPTLVLHRLGGTYGPVEYLLTAADHEIPSGKISLTFLNASGIPITKIELTCCIKDEIQQQMRQREIRFLADRAATLAATKNISSSNLTALHQLFVIIFFVHASKQCLLYKKRAYFPIRSKLFKKLEHSLIANNPRTLLQMNAGQGQTFTIMTSLYRLLEYANASKILFLFDNLTNLNYMLESLNTYFLPEHLCYFSDRYLVWHLDNDQFPSDGVVYLLATQDLDLLLPPPLVDEKYCALFLRMPSIVAIYLASILMPSFFAIRIMILISS